MINHTFQNDTLQRKKDAIKYVKFIHSLNGEITIALDSPWGTGKTKFIDFMCEELDKNEDLYIRYNAWDNDFTNEPFLSLMSDFFSILSEKDYINNNLKSFKEKAFHAAKVISPNLMKSFSKLIIGDSTTEKIAQELQNIAMNTSSDLIDDTFKAINTSKKSRHDFKEEFQKVIQTILQKKNKKQLIFIIDELDRCKPTFAIELLENIKHLFEIKEVIFFIAVDKEQLCESIKAVYGQNFDSSTYLHRFFDISLKLSKNKNHLFFQEKLKHLNAYGASKIFGYASSNLNLTLRDFERILSEIYTIKLLHENEEKLRLHVLTTLLILKYKAPKLYELICINQHQNFGVIKEKVAQLDQRDLYLNCLENVKDNLLQSTGYDEDNSNFMNDISNHINLVSTTLYEH